MKLTPLALLLGCLCWAPLANAEEATLTWTNGDTLGGSPSQADESSLTWRSPLFSDALRMELGALSSIRFPSSPVPPPEANEFRVVLRNGDVLTGQLAEISGETLRFVSRRWGEFTLARSQVLSLQKGNNAGVVYSGPRGLAGWKQPARPSANANQRQILLNNGFAVPGNANADALAPPTDWIEDPDGSISTNKADATLFLPLELPDRFEVDVEVHSKAACSFSLIIGPASKEGLQLDTWIDAFVITQGSGQMAQLRLIGPADHIVRVRMFVDYAEKKASVYSVSGAKLGEIPVRKDWKVGGLTIRKRDSDVTLRRLRVSHWDGTPPRQIASGDTLVQTADGQARLGLLQDFSPESGTLGLTVDGQVQRVSLADVSTVIVSGDDAAPVIERSPASAAWLDGCLVSGKMKSLDGEAVTLEVSYAKQPLRCRLEGMSRLGLSGADAGGEQTDRLIHAGGALRGSLQVDGEGGEPIRFRPVGGLNASSLRNGGDARFLRGANAAHFADYPELLKGFPDMIYLTNNDVLPCRILACTEEEVRLETPFTEMRAFPAARVRAVEFGQPERRHHKGIGGEGWQGQVTAVTGKPDTVQLKSGAVISHPAAMTGDTVRFELEWPADSYNTLTVMLFTGGKPDAQPAGNQPPAAINLQRQLGGINVVQRGAGNPGNDPDATPVTFFLMPNQMQILDKNLPQDPNQLINQIGNGNAKDYIGLTKPAALIEMAVRDGSLVISVNGEPKKTVAINPAGAGRRGISLASNILMTGNGRIQLSSVLGGNANPTLNISGFEIDTLSGGSIRQFIAEEARQAVLTVPRFRRESPPSHVLLAPNGDLLRGRLLDIDPQQVRFESRLEPLRFERDRVAAVVWLHPELALPAEGKEPAAPIVPPRDETAVQAYMADGYQITFTPQRMANGQLLGTSPDLGQCSIPAATIRELYLGNPVNRDQLAAYTTWIPKHSKEPDWDIPAADGGNSEAHALIGQMAEDFALPMLDGSTFKLSDHKDKVVVLDFWATWCGPCVMALPGYIEVFDEFDGQPVVFIGVNLQEASDHVRGFLVEHEFQLDVALDRAGDVGAKFHVSGIPHTVVIGKGNVIEDLHVGYAPGTADTLRKSVQAMLDGKWERKQAPAAPPANPQPPPPNSI